MGACDFTLWPEWSYDDMNNDTSLSNFTIAKDLVQRSACAAQLAVAAVTAAR